MKKGFTLIEIIIVLAILAILLTISTINFGRFNQSSKVDSLSNDVAAMLKDVYENSNKQLNYDSWKVEMIKDGEIYKIFLKENDNVLRNIETKNIDLTINNGNNDILLKDESIIQFDSNGNIRLKSKDKDALNYDLSNEYDRLLIVLSYKKNSTIRKTIEINSIPPGNITIK